ncbi:MAG: ABC transporter ATP-binding protein [Ignavibacteria bacterium]
MIVVKELAKTYTGSVKALDGISFDIGEGEVCGYLGANGAGKSTTIKILTGMIKPDSGYVEINGINILENGQKAKKIIGYVPESGSMFLSLTPYDFLEFVCKIYELEKSVYHKRIYDFMEMFDLANEVNTTMAGFSKGMRQKVLIISSLIHNPDIIFWDEPLGGVDFNTNMLIRDLVKELSAGGKIILYSTHVLDMVDKICSRVIILNLGKIVYDSRFDKSENMPVENIFRQYMDAEAGKNKAAEIYKNLNNR